MQARIFTVLFLCTTSQLSVTVCAADWPMWRFDVQRSGASPSDLPDKVHLQWSRQLPRVRPAWPNEPRLHFDGSYEPIVVKQHIIVGSPNDGSVTAYDTATGSEQWKFFTDGPVRLAPVGSNGNVYVGSDDGYLYCLNNANGSLRWKVRGAPNERREYWHLGNGRLISVWPVRGGPVVADGVVYFGAGIWPTMGVFVHAVDATTGKVVWSNTNSHAIENVRIDHNYLHESGISPQGHLLIAGDMLIVPNGRSMPARLDRRTGKLHYFVQGYRNGDSRVIVSDKLALVGASGVVRLDDGREIASLWAAAGKDAPSGWSAKKDLFEGPFYPYKFLPGLDYRSVINDGVAYGTHQGTIFAYELSRAETSRYDKDDAGRVLKPARWTAPLKWKLDVEQGIKLPQNTMIRAGARLYTHVGKRLIAIEPPKDNAKSATVAWSKDLESIPSSCLAADNKLFVVTSEGEILCFGGDTGESHNHSLQPSPLADRSDQWSDIAADVFRPIESKNGYALVMGLSNGRLVEELLSRSEMKVIAIDSDSNVINDLRRRLATDGPFDSRFQAIVADPRKVELAPYLATLIVSERPDVLDLRSTESIRQIIHTLRPYGGTACFALSTEKQAAVKQAADDKKLSGARIETSAKLLTIRRIGALPGSADWTHETGDAARSFFSKDELVQAPLAVLWYGDGPDHGFYKRKDYGHGVKPQVAGGRLFALQIATNTMHAVDAYTGRLLWVRKVGSSARYASLPDAVYVADNRTCEVLDPATGKPRATFSIDVKKPDDQPVSVSDIRVAGDVILIAMRFDKENAISKGRWNSKLLVALDRESGRQLWTREAVYRYNTAAIAMTGDRVFCIDSHSPIEIASMRRRGEPVDVLPSSIITIDARTGREIWKQVKNDPPADLSSLHFMSLRTQDDWLAYSSQHKLLLTGKGNKTYALSAETGDVVWEKPIRGHQPLILGPDTFINQAGHTYETLTGKVIDGQPLFRRGGCNYAVGNKNLLFLRSNCAAYVDIESRKQYNVRNLRSGCSNSLVAADGLLNVPCFSVGCVCNYPIQTSFAMFHMPQSATWHGTPTKQDVQQQAAGE